MRDIDAQFGQPPAHVAPEPRLRPSRKHNIFQTVTDLELPPGGRSLPPEGLLQRRRMLSLPRIVVLIVLSALWIAFGAELAFASRRVALVVGNSAYKDPALVLTNPRSDAEDIAKALVNLGFDVTLALNASTRDMDTALKRFGDQASGADVALFFYAGHALQYQGNNFLMPVDSALEDEIDLRRNMVTDEQIRIALERTSGVRIMILDACRNNPMADRFKRTVLGMTRGIEFDARPGTHRQGAGNGDRLRGRPWRCRARRQHHRAEQSVHHCAGAPHAGAGAGNLDHVPPRHQ